LESQLSEEKKAEVERLKKEMASSKASAKEAEIAA